MAPPSAPKMTALSTTVGSMIPLPMVAATAVPKKAKAMKLKKAAQITACAGDSTRVETMVAMELAASCMPFKKSNSSATAIRKIRMARPASMEVAPA